MDTANAAMDRLQAGANAGTATGQSGFDQVLFSENCSVAIHPDSKEASNVIVGSPFLSVESGFLENGAPLDEAVFVDGPGFLKVWDSQSDSFITDGVSSADTNGDWIRASALSQLNFDSGRYAIKAYEGGEQTDFLTGQIARGASTSLVRLERDARVNKNSSVTLDQAIDNFELGPNDTVRVIARQDGETVADSGFVRPGDLANTSFDSGAVGTETRVFVNTSVPGQGRSGWFSSEIVTEDLPSAAADNAVEPNLATGFLSQNATFEAAVGVDAGGFSLEDLSFYKVWDFQSDAFITDGVSSAKTLGDWIFADALSDLNFDSGRYAVKAFATTTGEQTDFVTGHIARGPASSLVRVGDDVLNANQSVNLDVVVEASGLGAADAVKVIAEQGGETVANSGFVSSAGELDDISFNSGDAGTETTIHVDTFVSGQGRSGWSSNEFITGADAGQPQPFVQPTPLKTSAAADREADGGPVKNTHGVDDSREAIELLGGPDAGQYAGDGMAAGETLA